MTRHALTIDLPGPWTAIDPENPFPAGTDPETVLEFRRVGLVPDLPSVPDVTPVLMGRLTVPPGPEPGSDPILATLSIIEGRPEHRVTVDESEPGVIEPIKTTWRSTIAWPEGVGDVTLHHVRYTFPSPTGDTLYAAEFATPNLMIVEGMEAYFEAVMAGVAFVEILEVGESSGQDG